MCSVRSFDCLPVLAFLKGQVANPSLKVNALATWVALAVNSLIAFLLTPFILAHLGKTGYGIWTLIGSFAGYYGLMNMGIGSAVTRYVARHAGRGEVQQARETISTAVSFFGFAGLAVVAASFLLAPALGRFFSVPPGDLGDFVCVVRVMGLATGIGFLGGVFTAILGALELFVVSNGISVASNVLRVLLTVLALKHGLGLPGVAWATLVSGLFICGAGFWCLRRFRPHLSAAFRLASWSSFRLLLGFGLITTVISVADILRSDIDAVVVAKAVGLQEVAGYSIASSLVRLMVGLTTAGLIVLMPRFSFLEGAGDKEGMRRLFRRSLTLSALVSFGCAMVLCGFGEPLIRIWVGAAFPQSHRILFMLAAATAFAIAQSPGISLLYALRKHHVYAGVTLAEGAANLTLSILLAKALGAPGVALGTLLSMLVFKVLVMPVYVSRLAGLSWADYLRPIAAAAAAAGAVTGVVLVAANAGAGPGSLLSLASAVALAGVLYAGLVLLLAAGDDRVFLLSFLKSARNQLRRAGHVCQGLLSRIGGAATGRRVLFFCPSPVMAEHLEPYWNMLKSDPRLTCRVLYDVSEARHSPGEWARMTQRLPPVAFRNKWPAYLFFPHLMITADHPFNCHFPRMLFVGHGGQGKVLADETQPYAYGMRAYRDGRLRYAMMFEESESLRARVTEGRADLAAAVRVTGSLPHDRLLAEEASRARYRARLNLGETDTAVLVLTTWGPNSLLSVYGEPFLREAARLSGSYRFIFALHPNEYRRDNEGRAGWGAALTAEAYPMFIIRDPAESWIPYLVASDLVISDHTSLVQSAALLRRPILVCPEPAALMMSGSVTERIYRFAPVIRRVQDMEGELSRARTRYPREDLNALAASMHACPGQAARRASDAIYELLAFPEPPRTL